MMQRCTLHRRCSAAALGRLTSCVADQSPVIEVSALSGVHRAANTTQHKIRLTLRPLPFSRLFTTSTRPPSCRPPRSDSRSTLRSSAVASLMTPTSGAGSTVAITTGSRLCALDLGLDATSVSSPLLGCHRWSSDLSRSRSIACEECFHRVSQPRERRSSARF